MITASLTKFRIPFKKESTVSRCCQNSASWVTTQNFKKMRFTDANKNLIPRACHVEQGSKNLLAHQNIFSLKLSFARGHWFCTVTQQCWHVLLQSHPHPRRGTYLHIMSPMRRFGLWRDRNSFSRILQIGATGGRWGPRSIKRTWEKAESWAHIRREAEGRRRG